MVEITSTTREEGVDSRMENATGCREVLPRSNGAFRKLVPSLLVTNWYGEDGGF